MIFRYKRGIRYAIYFRYSLTSQHYYYKVMLTMTASLTVGVVCAAHRGHTGAQPAPAVRVRPDGGRDTADWRR